MIVDFCHTNSAGYHRAALSVCSYHRLQYIIMTILSHTQCSSQAYTHRAVASQTMSFYSTSGCGRGLVMTHGRSRTLRVTSIAIVCFWEAEK